MRQLIMIIVLCAATTGGAQVQAKDNGGQARDNGIQKFSFAATLGTAIPLGGGSMPTEWQLSGYRNLTGRWSVGAGTGISFYETTLIPIFGSVRYRIGRERKFTPCAEAAAGYSFAPAGTVGGGLLLNPSLGVVCPLSDRMKLQLAVGYELQRFERLRTHSDGRFEKAFVEKLSHSGISIKAGVLF